MSTVPVWEARECMVFLGNDGGISLRNVINGRQHAKAIAALPEMIDVVMDLKGLAPVGSELRSRAEAAIAKAR